MKACLIALLLLGTTSVNAQSRKVVIDEDLEVAAGGDDDILSNEALKRATLGSKSHKVIVPDIVKIETMGLEYKFEDVKNWESRGRIIVGKDASGKIVNVEVNNDFLGSDKFKETLNYYC
jgi:hypothetical protein